MAAKAPAATPAGLSLWPAETCLVSELALELESLTPAELRATAVVLPTKRLAVWLLAMIARRRPVFVPPWTANLDEFIARLSPDAQVPPKALSELEQELLLAGLLKEGCYAHLKLGHEHEVRQLLDELVAWDLDDTAFERLETVIAEDIFRSEQALGSLHERVAELSAVAQRLDQALKSRGVTTPKRLARLRSRSLAALLAEGAPLLAPRPLERIYVAGFTSMERMHAPMLRELVLRAEARVWVTEPPPLHTDAHPVRMLINLFETPGHPQTPRVSRPAPAPLTVHRTSGVLTEVAHALALAQQAIAGGVPPSGIALLVTDDKAYGKALRALMPGAGFKANVALAMPLSTTVAGTWIAAALDILQGDDDVARILALATHPLTLARFPEATREALTGEILQCGVHAGLQAISGVRTLSPGTRAVIDGLLELLAPLLEARADAVRPLRAWAQALTPVVEAVTSPQSQWSLHAYEGPADERSAANQGPFPPNILPHSRELLRTEDDPGLRASTAEAVTRFLSTLGKGGELPLTKSEFLSLAGPRLIAQEVRGVGDPLKGVQVLSVEEARYVPFDLAIVLGATEGQFPRGVPQDYLLDNYLKTRIGLPGWQLLEAIEDTTFLLLKARLPAFALLYPAARGDEATVRSRFIEAAIAQGEASEQAIDAEAALLSSLRSVAAAHADGATAWQARVTTRARPQGATRAVVERGLGELTGSMSASALESLIQCPYRFLLSKLGVQALEFAEEDDARAEGDWLHDVLEAFFTGATAERRVAAPLDASLPWHAFRAYALERLDALTQSLAPRHARDGETQLHLKVKAWPAFVTHLMRVYTPETLARAGASLREVRIERDDGPVTVRVGAVEVKVRGLIDAVDERADGYLVTDYKRQRTPERREVRDGVSPQLPLYATALVARDGDRFQLRRAVIGYWSILGGRYEAIAAGAEAPAAWAETGLAAQPGSLETAVDSMLDLWSWRQSQVADGTFAPDPSRCGLCRLQGVCRKEDPEIGPGLKQGDQLAQRLKGGRPRPKDGTP